MMVLGPALFNPAYGDADCAVEVQVTRWRTFWREAGPGPGVTGTAAQVRVTSFGTVP